MKEATPKIDPDMKPDPRGAGDPRSGDEARSVMVKPLPIISTSDIYCRRLNCDRREVIIVTNPLFLGQGMVDCDKAT